MPTVVRYAPKVTSIRIAVNFAKLPALRRPFSAAPNGERERATGFTFSVLGGETVLGRNRFRSTVCKGMAFTVPPH